MDKKRAAIVTSAGIGLLVSALFLRKIRGPRRNHSDRSDVPQSKAVVNADFPRNHHPAGEPI